MIENKAKKSFEEHELFDMYAFGIFAKRLFDPSKFPGKKDLNMNLLWIWKKCCEQNPSKRPNPKQCYYYLTRVKKLLIEFWKKICLCISSSFIILLY